MKQAILVLHGWNLNGEKFIPLVKELQKSGYTAEAPDLPGFGTSKIPDKPLNLSDYVEYVDRYIKKRGWKEVIIIGHSFGGRISIKLAAKHPQYLKKIVLTGAPGYNPVASYKIKFFLTLAKIGKRIFALPLLRNFDAASRHFLYKAANARDFYTTNIHMQDTFKNIVNESLERYLDQISIPTLLIWGEEDQITPLWIGQKMEKTIPNAKLVVIQDSRHGVPWTKPKEFVENVISFSNKS